MCSADLHRLGGGLSIAMARVVAAAASLRRAAGALRCVHEFVEEVLKWIDPKNQCKWRFDSSQLNSKNKLTGIVQNGNLLRDVESIYRKISENR